MSRNVGSAKTGSLFKAVACLLLGAGLLLPCAVVASDASFRNSGIPRVQDATLDLAGYDDYDVVIPLDGAWEFYWDAWIVTDGMQDARPDALIELPRSWEGLEVDGKQLPASGIASYKLTVKNCPSDLGYIVRVPDSQTTYRVFVDGDLVLSGGYMSKDIDEIEVRSEVRSKAIGEFQPKTCDVVVEVACGYTGGLYMAPQLEEVRNAAVNPTLVSYVQSGVVVGLLVYIAAFGIIAAFRGSSFRADSLLFLCVILLIMVLTGTELMRLRAVKAIGAHFEYVWLIQALMFALLPACLYLCSRHLFGYRVGSRGIRALVVATTTMVAAALVLSVSPRPWHYVVLDAACVAACLAVVAFSLSRAWRGSDADALLFAGASTVLLSSLLVDALYRAGFFVINVSYLLGACTIFYATLMFAVFVKRMVAQERQAFELEQVRYQLKEAEVSLMLSQIRPHFLYNTLTAVMALIPTDPKLAQHALVKFSQYLRANIDAVTNVRMIPFSQELDHIKTYLDIEKLRFDDRLRVEFDVRASDFFVPQLSIQPLVENAVKHGVCKSADGGCVVLSTWTQEDAWCVQVVDDGAGFDASALDLESEGSAGIRNVMYRLEAECDAKVRFESAPGQGCAVTVTLPKGENHG